MFVELLVTDFFELRSVQYYRLIDAKFIEDDLRGDYQWIEMDVTEAIRRRRPNMNKVCVSVNFSIGKKYLAYLTVVIVAINCIEAEPMLFS